MEKLIDNLYDSFDNNTKVMVTTGNSWYNVEFESIVESITYSEEKINVLFVNVDGQPPIELTLKINDVNFEKEVDEEFDCVTYMFNEDVNYLNITFI